MSEPPQFVPPHRVPCWLSSEDVRDAITRVGMSRRSNEWRACCWDVQQEIYKLIEAQRP